VDGIEFDYEQYIQREGYGGAFPWQLNYDAGNATIGNALFPYLAQGLFGHLPAPTPAPTPGPHVPALLPLQAPLYVYATRGAAEEGCVVSGFRGLCAKADLAGHDQCAAGWCTDYEGYWIAKVCSTDNNFWVLFLLFCLLNWILRLL
jgi:hypothetical protein